MGKPPVLKIEVFSTSSKTGVAYDNRAKFDRMLLISHSLGGLRMAEEARVVSRLIAAAIISALVICAGTGVFFVWKFYPWVLFGSQTVRIATPPVDSKSEVFLTAFKQEIGAEHAGIRLSLV